MEWRETNGADPLSAKANEINARSAPAKGISPMSFPLDPTTVHSLSHLIAEPFHQLLDQFEIRQQFIRLRLFC